MTAALHDTARTAPAAEPPQSHGEFTEPQPAAERPMIAIELLTANPGNARRDISLDQEFLDSIAELGILTPLRVTP